MILQGNILYNFHTLFVEMGLGNNNQQGNLVEDILEMPTFGDDDDLSLGGVSNSGNSNLLQTAT